MRSGLILTTIATLAVATTAVSSETETTAARESVVAEAVEAIDGAAESADAAAADPVAADPVAGAEATDASPDAGSGPDGDWADADVAAEETVAGGDADDAVAEGEVDEVMTTEKPAAVLGQVGYDSQGRPGRIHIVVPGDTLWDISDAYLGTPWVWPSIWTDNDKIENPHLIMPDDRIWITPYEMRRISPEEADRLLAGQPSEDLPPAAFGEDASMDLMDSREVRTMRVSSVETTGLITSEQLEASASVVDAVPDRVMLSQGDEVHIGYGEGQTVAGDQFTVFRTREKVFDPDTGRMLGYHVDLLGWVQVKEVSAESSLATVELSASDMEVGDRVIPREPPVLDVEILESPEGVEGKISFFPQSRVLMGMIDYVYLNRGELDGLAVGSPLEVYRAGWKAPEPARDARVEVPERVIAQMLVVRARPQTSVAIVTHTEGELELGDRFRGVSP